MWRKRVGDGRHGDGVGDHATILTAHRRAAATVVDDRHTMTDGLPWKRPAQRRDAGRHDHHHHHHRAAAPTVFHPDPATIRRAIERRSVATLATVSGVGRPHAATVLYQCVDDALFVSTHRQSRKARNVADHGVAAVTIAVRRLPIGPPASIQFQSSATVLANDDPEIIRLAASGQARPDHRPRRDGPRRRLLPAPRAPRPPRHLRAGDVAVAGHPPPARRSRRGPPVRESAAIWCCGDLLPLSGRVRRHRRRGSGRHPSLARGRFAVDDHGHRRDDRVRTVEQSGLERERRSGCAAIAASSR